MEKFRAVVATGDGPAKFRELTDADLPDDALTVDVTHSSLNYKDGLAVANRSRIARRYPLVCGIDFAGVVAESSDPAWTPGDEIVVTGWGMSDSHDGGYTQRQRVKPEWPVLQPAGFTTIQAMAIGTAGLTAMLSVLALEQHGLSPEVDGEVLVTGAAGGVGGVAIAILAQLGYRVVASTGRTQEHGRLARLGATAFLDRAELAEAASSPLGKERWAGAIDAVGGTTLASVLRQARYGAAVATCGLAGGSGLPTTVLPFILRGVSLLGIDSVYAPNALRTTAWHRLQRDLPTDRLDELTTVEPLSRIHELAEEILAGSVRGRVVLGTHS